MKSAIQSMLQKYNCHTQQDYLNALKEILQEIALLGLWRAKFYEKAAFYGGSALRILYGLDRFSEDLDFTLLTPNKNFKLDEYNQAISDELKSFGFEMEVITKNKNIPSQIESAFIKGNTKQQLLAIEPPAPFIKHLHANSIVKIKMEVDTDPPDAFTTETKTLLQPIPFSVKTLVASDLFAGKIHALLCRPWQSRIKGRDWYDFVWYISRGTTVNLAHLRERMIQSNHWRTQELLAQKNLLQLLSEKIQQVDFDAAKKDVIHFLNDKQSIALWSNDFFQSLLEKIKIVDAVSA